MGLCYFSKPFNQVNQEGNITNIKSITYTLFKSFLSHKKKYEVTIEFYDGKEKTYFCDEVETIFLNNHQI